MSYNLTGAAQGGNLTLSRAGGATANISGLSGAASTFTIQNVTYTNQGKFFFKATAAGATTPVNNAASASAVAAVAATGAAFVPMVTQQAPSGSTTVFTGSACAFVWGLDALGNVRVAQGPLINYTDTSALSTRCPLPTLPDWFTPVSYVVIKFVSATASVWTFGTSLWNATGITIDPLVDVITLTATDPLTA